MIYAYTWNNQWKLNKNELSHICGWSYLRSKFGKWLSSTNSNEKLIVLDPFTTTMLKTNNHPYLGVFIKSIAKGTITTKIFGICVVGHYGIVMVVRVRLWIIFTQHTVLMHQTIFKYFFWQLVNVQKIVFAIDVIFFPPK